MSPAEPTWRRAATARRKEVALAGHRGEVDRARMGLDDEDAGVRATALQALQRTGAATAGDVQRGLRDASPSVRRRAAEVAARHREVDLLDALHDDDDGVVEMAAFACGEHEEVDERVVARLAALTTSHDDPLVREAAVAALGAIGSPAGLAAVLVATHDRANVRRRAVIALAPFDGPEVDDALERARHDRDWQVRQAAEDLLDG